MDEYDEIARRFFAQFLELKVQFEDGQLHPSKEIQKDIAQYRKLNEKLKEAVNETTAEATRFEEALALAEEEKVALQARVNELIIENGMLLQKLQGLGRIDYHAKKEGVPFTELMSEESRREWDRIMREIPRDR